MTNYLIVPGLGGSGADHWQTFFESTQHNFQRVYQKDWNKPVISDWIENLDKAVFRFNPENVILVAHSLGCLTVAEWAWRFNRKIKGALLVAPPDFETLQTKIGKQLFDKKPYRKIDFKTILVASTNDEWASIEQAEAYAKNWGSDFINIGKAGHINQQSGFGKWDEGLEILKKLH